jgi:hypothetical protein
MNINDLIAICKSYSDLGWAIQEQFEQLVEGGAGDYPADVNPNAMRAIRGFLKELPPEIEDIEDILDEIAKAEGGSPSDESRRDLRRELRESIRAKIRG